MIKEIFHYITLKSKTRKRLKECAFLMSSNLDAKTNSEIKQLISNYEIYAVIDVLVKCGNSHNISNKQYWSNLHIVARDHKIADKIMYLKGMTENGARN